MVDTNKALEGACAAYWEHYRSAWGAKGLGILGPHMDVPFGELPEHLRLPTLNAVSAAVQAYLAVVGR